MKRTKQEITEQITEQRILEVARDVHEAMTKLQELTTRQSWQLTNDAVGELHGILHEMQVAALQAVKKIFPDVSSLDEAKAIHGWQYIAPNRHPNVRSSGRRPDHMTRAQ
jgi:hypothetical protein